jgi:hypothetical protein
MPSKSNRFNIIKFLNVYNLRSLITVLTLGFSLCIFSSSCFSLSLRSKYSLQHPVLKHPQPMFFPFGEGSSFTPIQNIRWSFTFHSEDLRSQSNSVSVGYRLDDRGLFLATASGPPLGPIQPPIQWVPDPFLLGIKRPVCEAEHSLPSSAKFKNTWSAGVRAGWAGVRVPAEAGNFSLHHRVQTGFGAHPTSYPMCTWGSFPRGKAAGPWSWPLTSI